MANTNKRTRKRFLLNTAKIKRAQKVLGAKTESETIELALNLVIADYRRTRIVQEANHRFVRSGIKIKDVYEKLAN